MYKLDHLFWSIWGSDEKTHLLHRHFIFLTCYNSRLFMHSVCTIQGHVINFQPFLSSFPIFHSFTDLFWELNDREIEKHYKITLKRLKLGMVSSFHPHSRCEKVKRVTVKTGCTSCTNWTISFEVSGFRTKKLIGYTDTAFFKLITTPPFFAFSMHHSKPRHQLSTLSGIICYFSCIYWFVVRAKWSWTWKALQNELWKGWNLAWYHHFTDMACAKK